MSGNSSLGSGRAATESTHRSRQLISWVLAGTSAVAAASILLAGADLPPPPGFLFVLLAVCGFGVLIGLTLPRVLKRWDRLGAGSTLAWASALGALLGLATTVVLVSKGPGEPTIPAPGVQAYLIFAGVLVVLGGLCGFALALVARAADRASTPWLAAAIAGLPGLVLVGVAAVVIASRVNNNV